MKITLCGSAKFEADYHKWNEWLTLTGHIVHSLAVFPSIKGEKNWYGDHQKMMLDLAHLAKIMESDAIVVINTNKYTGESTNREIEWARMMNKRIWYTEPKNSTIPNAYDLVRRPL